MSNPQDPNRRGAQQPGGRMRPPPQNRPGGPGAQRPRPAAGATDQEKKRPAGRPRRRRLHSENRWFRAIVMVLATVVGCVFLALFALESAYDMFGLNQRDMIAEVKVPDKAKISDVANLLKENGVVDQPLTFQLYLWFKDVNSDDVVGGEYAFNANMSYNELISALSSGYTEREEVRITFPEGMTLLEIAKELEAARVCDADEFIAYLNSDAEYSFEFFGAIEDDPLRYHKLEGYLFPDTYDFFIDEQPQSVARKFIRNFNDKLTPALQERMQEMNLTIDETITLASIIQREAGESGDMRLVSSVFHNRLNDGGNFPNLQSDVTILYVEENIKPRIQIANQAMYDAYNTYVREGLPVGPICSPGIEAIEAALYPESTQVKFYYFVTDINMDFYYAATLEAHNRNIQAAAQAGGEVHGVGTQ